MPAVDLPCGGVQGPGSRQKGAGLMSITRLKEKDQELGTLNTFPIEFSQGEHIDAKGDSGLGTNMVESVYLPPEPETQTGLFSWVTQQSLGQEQGS